MATSRGTPTHSGIADFNVTGFLRTASPGFSNSVRIGKTLQFSDTLTWLVDKHSLKFGGDYRNISSTLTNPQTQPRGLLHASTATTRATAAPPTPDTRSPVFCSVCPNRVQRDFVDTYPEVSDSFRRILRPGRLPRHAESHAESRTALGPADLAGGKKQPADELQPARRLDSPRVARQSWSVDDELLRRLGAATGHRLLAG